MERFTTTTAVPSLPYTYVLSHDCESWRFERLLLLLSGTLPPSRWAAIGQMQHATVLACDSACQLHVADRDDVDTYSSNVTLVVGQQQEVRHITARAG